MTDTADTTPVVPPRRRLWHSFSAATLMLLVAASSIPLAWVGLHPRRADDDAGRHPRQADDDTGKFWPGMWLCDRTGRFRIHIYSDGRRSSGVPALISHLDHEDAGIRESAAGWLRAIGHDAKAAIPALKKAVNDPDARVRAAAAEAIEKIEAP